jgi:predicted NBD/HSP70 family sugar kinase
MIGVELTGAGARAVLVGDDGQVIARAVEQGSDLAAAAVGAMSAVCAPGERSQPVAVAASFAAAIPDAPAVVEAMQMLAGTAAQGGTAVVRSSGVAAAAAEAWIGAARGRSDVVFFGVGDHATAGILKNGAPLGSVRGRAGAVGWLALNPVEREDYRKTGCLEAEVAAAGIVRRLIWRIKAGDRSQVSDRVDGDYAAVVLDDVLAAARAGDGVSISVMRDTAKYLGMAAANLVAVCDPDVLVLGGIMASASDLLLEPVRTELARRLPAAMLDPLSIEPARLGEDGPAIGAARLAQVPRP